MARVFKYNLDWQIARVRAKKIKNVGDKLSFIEGFYENFYTINNKDRIINWLDGLEIAYPKDREDLRGMINQCREEIKLTTPSLLEVEELAYKSYEKEDLQELLSDLFARNNKWLKSGYANKDVNKFLVSLIDYLKEVDTSSKFLGSVAKYEKLFAESVFLPNTWKWKY